MSTMKAARLHKVGGAFQVDDVEMPVPGDDDVVIEVKAANLVQNLRNVIATYPTEKPFLPLPELPAIFVWYGYRRCHLCHGSPCSQSEGRRPRLPQPRQGDERLEGFPHRRRPP